MGLRTVAVAIVLAGLAGACGQNSERTQLHSQPSLNGASSSVPAEFRPACGHPGVTVKVRKVPVTIPHAECDLTGVTLVYGNAGAGVPVKGEGVSAEVLGAAGTNGGGELSVETDAKTGDVTVRL